MRDELRFFAVAFDLEPVEHGGCLRLIVLQRAVRPAALAGDHIQDAVAVHVSELHGVELTEFNAHRAVFDGGSHELVLGEGSIGFLLEPAEAVAMRIVAADHIVATVTVHIIDKNEGTAAAACRREELRVEDPVAVGLGVCGLFAPAFFVEDVSTTVAIHITHAVAVRVAEVFLVVLR